MFNVLQRYNIFERNPRFSPTACYTKNWGLEIQLIRVQISYFWSARVTILHTVIVVFLSVSAVLAGLYLPEDVALAQSAAIDRPPAALADRAIGAGAVALKVADG